MLFREVAENIFSTNEVFYQQTKNEYLLGRLNEEIECSTPVDDIIHQIVEQFVVIFSYSCQIFCKFVVVFVLVAVVSLMSHGRKSRNFVIVTSITVSTIANLCFAFFNLSIYFYEKELFKITSLFFKEDLFQSDHTSQIVFIIFLSFAWLLVCNKHRLYLTYCLKTL